MNYFLNFYLDVHVMFATLASPEELRPFVANFDRDIIRMGQFTKYHEAAPEIAKRLATGMTRWITFNHFLTNCVAIISK